MSDDYEPIIDPLLGEIFGGHAPPDLKQQILAAHAERMSDYVPIIDPLLEESLGTVQPPDLKQPILSAHAEQDTVRRQTAEEFEPVIDPLLDELLGSQTPPDLKQQILSKLNQDATGSPDGEVRIISKAIDTATTPVVHSMPVVEREPIATQRGLNRSSKARHDWRGWILAASVLIAAGTFAVWALDQFGTNGNPVSVADNDPIGNVSDPSDVTPQNSGTNDSTSVASTIPSIPLPSRTFDTPKPEKPDVSPQEYDAPSRPQFARTKTLGTPRDTDRIVQLVNRELKVVWQAHDKKPTGRLPENQVMNRVAQVLVGRGMNASEISAFENDKEAAIDAMMRTPEFVEHWGDYLADVLVGNSDSKRFDREQLAQFLRKSLQDEKPYDHLAFELITAVGSNDRQSPDYDAATNFVIAHQVPTKSNKKSIEDVSRLTQVTDKVCQTFLGAQMQCARCHAHKSNRIAQDDYWKMAAYFLPTSVQKLGDNTFGLSDIASTDSTLTYESPDRVQESIDRPAFFLDSNENENDDNLVGRRAELAKKIVSSDSFAKATINRLWDRSFGMGFTHPVDDMGPHNPPSHPKLLDELATEFANNEYDVRSALKWMLMSDAFSLSARHPADPLNNEHDLFSSFPSQTQAYPQVASALRSFAAKRSEDGGAEASAVLASIAVGQDRSNKELMSYVGDMARVNGKLREKMLHKGPDGLLRKIADSKLTPQEKVQHVFRATLGRDGRKNELKSAMQVMDGELHPINALQDIGWILLNTDEFAKLH